MSVNVNRSFIHKLIVVVVFTCIFVSTSYIAYNADTGSGVQVLTFIIAMLTGVVLSWFFCFYAWYAIFASDRYTFQEWVQK